LRANRKQREEAAAGGSAVEVLTVMVVFTWPYLLGSLARFLSSLSWLSLDISQQDSSAYLARERTGETR